MEMRGLPNTRKIRKCQFANSTNAAIRVLRKGLVATSAGDNGAIHVYVDRNGKYRCEAMRYMHTMAAEIFNSQAAVRGWYGKWLTRIQR